MTRRAHSPGLARRAPRPGGFSLLEILAATVVLAGALVIVLESVASGQSATARLQRQMAAHSLAGDVLDRAAAGESDPLPQQGRTNMHGTEFRWAVTDSPARRAGLRQLTCLVRWQCQGQEQSVALYRLVEEPTQEP